MLVLTRRSIHPIGPAAPCNRYLGGTSAESSGSQLEPSRGAGLYQGHEVRFKADVSVAQSHRWVRRLW